MSFIKAFTNRLPTITQVTPVYAITVLLVYGWTLGWFFWKFSSWLYFMSIGEILVIFAYTMITNFLESLFVLLFPVILSFVLPKKWFLDLFVVRATTLVILMMGYMMYFSMQILNLDYYPKTLILLTIPVTIIFFILVYGIGKNRLMCKLIETLSDRSIIFLYLSIPLSFISFCVVIVRNIF
jgi:hypothetical protein